jgi:hypothetical protein
MSALRFKVPHPDCALGFLQSKDAPNAPAVDRFAAHGRKGFENLRHLI